MLRLEMVLLLSFAGCSLMRLDEFARVPCRDHSDCVRASQSLPDPDGCGSYQCRDGLCVLPSNEEICNREDDDCNGWIDDGIVRVSGERPGEPPAVPTAFAAASDGSTTYVAIGGDFRKAWIITEEGALESQEPLRYEASSADREYPCPTATGAAACDFSQMAIGADPLHLVYAAINRNGCSRGQLRVGLSSADNEPFSVWLGKSVEAQSADKNNIAFGVDIDERNCTGASVGRSGASHPAVAVMDTTEGKAGALVSWLFTPSAAESESSEGCSGSESMDVGALGVFVPASEREWLNGTDNGNPVVLGQTQSRSPPAVVALRTVQAPAYLVAFSTSEDAVRGIRVRPVRSATKALQPEPRSLFIPDPDPHRVVLAVGAESSSSAEIGIAWTSGCGPDRVLRFATIRYATQGPQDSELTLVTAARTIESRLFSGGPFVLFEPEGFAAAPPTGGWSLLWMEASPEKGRELKLARYGESELEALNQTTLVSGGVGFPIVYPGRGSELSYALIRLDDAGRVHLEIVGGWCDVRD